MTIKEKPAVMKPRVAGAAAALAALCVFALPADAQTPTTDAPHPPAPAHQVEQRPAVATFEGRTINLAEGWDGARACVVWRGQGILDCYRTEAEGRARVRGLQASSGARAAGAPGGETSFALSSNECGGPLELYSGTWWGGSWIFFYDRGYWQNLSDYGFDNRTSSFAVGPCYVHLAEHSWGGGWWYPGDTSPWGSAGWMGSWDNRVSSIYIE
jgi:hypothetical protein